MAESNRKTGRVLAIDPGTKRIGLAVSDPLGITAQGLDTFEAGAGKDFLDHLGGLVELHGIDTVVVGLPLSMQGKDIEGSGRSRALASRIAERFRARSALDGRAHDEPRGGAGAAERRSRLRSRRHRQAFRDAAAPELPRRKAETMRKLSTILALVFAAGLIAAVYLGVLFSARTSGRGRRRSRFASTRACI